MPESAKVVPFTPLPAAERQRLTQMNVHSDGSRIGESHTQERRTRQNADADVDWAWRARFEDLESELRNRLNSRDPKER